MKVYSILIVTICSLSGFAKDYKFGTHTKKPISDVASKQISDACEKVGLKCSVEEMPGKRALQMANAGKIDGDATRVPNFKNIVGDKASNLIKVETPVIEIEVVLLAKSGELPIDASWKSASEKKVAFIRGSKMIEKNIDEKSQSPVDTLDQALQLLEKGRVGYVASFRRQLEEYIQQKGLSGYEIHKKPLKKSTLHLYLHKSNADVASKISDGLSQLK